MTKKNIKFSADKVTVQGVEVHAEGVPVEDVVGALHEYDVADNMDKQALLSAIGMPAIEAWLAENGYTVI